MRGLAHGTTRSTGRHAASAVVLALAVLLLHAAGADDAARLSAAEAAFPEPDWRSAVAPSILARLATPEGAEALGPGERAEAAALYAPGRGRGLWLDASGSLAPDAREALGILAAAPDDGLDPGDYEVSTLVGLAAAVDAAPLPDLERLAAFDVRLSAATLRYLHHLHRGRIDPRTLGVRLAIEPEHHDVVGALQEALSAHRLQAMRESLSPALPHYQALRRQLARYRSLRDVADVPRLSGAGVVRLGDVFVAADALRRRLAAFGDVAAVTPPTVGADIYDDELAAGVRRFQARHGLAADGVLGRATQAALAVPVRSRIRQIELALERLRWLPDVADERVVALNIPMFRLGAWDDVGAAGPALRMRAIVGRALVTETPVFTAMMRTVVFRPFWNVPRSILLKEILPAVERDPGLLSRLAFEIVQGQSDDARVVPATPDTLARLRAGTLRLRQRPGPANALGLVKFVFPNDADVYLHGTPALELFEHPRRDFSHGCVRLEDPTALAVWVLRDEPGWDRTRIEAAMGATASSRVALSSPIRVVLFYTTAVSTDDGTLHFADDIYGHDARLEKALAQPRHRAWRPAP